MAKQQKFRFLWNMEYSRNIPEKWQNCKKIDFFGIWNIPGIFVKKGETAKMSIFLNMEYSGKSQICP